MLRSLRGRAQLKLSHAFHVVAQKISSNHKSPQSPTISSYKNQISSNIFKNYSIRLQKFYLLRSRCKAANLGGALFLRLGFRRLVLRPDGVDRAHIVALFTRGHWAITKVNERSVAVTSQIDDENNSKETEGVERNSVKFNLTFDQLKSLDVKILPGAFGAEACIVRCEHHRFFQRVCVCFDCWLRGCAATSWSFGLISLELVSVVDNWGAVASSFV